MPNYCDYTLKVKGTKENCNKFLKKMEDYDEPNHFFRIFEASVNEEGEDFLEVSGYCAWSIESCCRAGGYSEGVDLFAVNTADLDLDLEVWSREDDGCFFEEHYVYHKGTCEDADCIGIIPYPPSWWDKDEYPTFQSFIEEWGLDDDLIKEEDYDEDGEYIGDWDYGGFSSWGEFSI